MGYKTTVLLATALGAFATFASNASANTYTPNTTGDHPANGCTPSDCTVREALDAANAHAGADTIVLQGGKVYNVTLNPSKEENANAAGDLDVNGDLTIKRSGSGFAVLDAHGLNRVLDVGPAGGVTLKLENIWVRNGLSREGAGIRSGGTAAAPAGDDHLTLIESRVTGSRAVGPPEAFGGGIESRGHGTTLTVVRSTISGNRTTPKFGGTGAGIELIDMGTARVIASTISGNTTQQGPGGGIFLLNGATKLIVINSTIANNKATAGGGGIYASTAAVVLRNATIVRNHGDSDATGGDLGGGIELSSGANAQVSNTILALNTAFPGDTQTRDCAKFGGSTITSLGRNLFSNKPGTGLGGCGSAFHFPPNILQPNPHLGKLASNGGPTKTIALLSGSKAINHAGPGAPPRDQRGVKRDSHPDIGAFER